MRRTHDEMVNTDAFHTQLLQIMANAAGMANSDKHVKTELSRIANKGQETQVVDARFALGADNGAYLRSNVMPLQTADGNCDTRNLSSHLLPELEAAGRTGALQALATELQRKQREGKKELVGSLSVLGYLLSIPEVFHFTKKHFGTEGPAARLVASFEGPGTARPAIEALLQEASREAACEILEVVMVLFGKPRDIVEAQLAATLGANGTGTEKLRHSLDTLALAARFIPATKAADQFRHPTVEIRAAETAAVFVNMLLTNRVELTAVHFPPGYDPTDEFDAPDNMLLTAQRRERRRKRHVSIGAAGDDIKPVSELEKDLTVAQRRVVESNKKLQELKTSANPTEEPKAELIASATNLLALHEVTVERLKKLIEIARLWQDNPLRGIVVNLINDLEALNLTEVSQGIKAIMNEQDGPRLRTYLDEQPNIKNDPVLTLKARKTYFYLKQIETAMEELGRITDDLQAKTQQPSRAASGPTEPDAPAPAPALDPVVLVIPEAPTAPAPSPAPMVPVPPVEDEVPVPGFCDDMAIVDDEDHRQAVHGLCAAVSQMREAGGALIINNNDRRFVRRTGVSPVFTEAHERSLDPRAQAEDWWAGKLWPQGTDVATVGPALTQKLADAERKLGRPSAPSKLMTDRGYATAYAVARGLCGERPPHHFVSEEDKRNGRKVYNLPRSDFLEIYERDPPPVSSTEESRRKDMEDKLFGTSRMPLREDFVDAPVQEASVEAERIAAWAPVGREMANTGNEVYVVQDSVVNNAVGESVVLEALLEHYKREAIRDGDLPQRSLLALACAATTKILQLPFLGIVMNEENRSKVCNPYPHAKGNNHYFVTRPVIRCPGPKARILYPCDAGLAGYAQLNTPLTPGAEGPQSDNLTGLSPDKAYGACTDDNECTERVKVDRVDATLFMRAALGGASLYVAAPPGIGDGAVRPPAKFTPPQMRDYNAVSLPTQEQAGAADPDNMEAVLRRGLLTCLYDSRYKNELSAIQASLKEAPIVPEPEDIARERRQAVWNDSMREACISGDRLYDFIRQFSGTISEPVDAVCMIDEGMLVRQQQQRRESRERLADRAAQEHMQLVRSVFGAVIRESGLTLGIEKEGNIGQLKVVSNTLRKQASELASGGSSKEGYFANSVRLENLLTQGTGEMTLTDLFGRLKEAGRALQEAAFAAQPVDGVPGSSASLDFLSAPRNSLVLRYKPDALAAIKKAFETFQREMLAQHDHIFHRAISAYELIEGKDESLVTAFASFAAHVLVHSRLYSTSTAMYVAAWPAAANAQQLKISLQRLVRVACEYLASSGAPNFLAIGGRDAYFGTTAAPPRVAPPQRKPAYLGGWY